MPPFVEYGPTAPLLNQPLYEGVVLKKDFTTVMVIGKCKRRWPKTDTKTTDHTNLSVVQLFRRRRIGRVETV